MAVRVAGELAPCGRAGEWGSDPRNAWLDPTCPSQRPRPGSQGQVQRAGQCRLGARADRSRAIPRVCVGRARGEAGAEALMGLPRRPGGLGFPGGGALGHPGRACSGVRRTHPAALPQGLFSGYSGSRSASPIGWKPWKVAKEGPRETLSQKVLRMASQHRANARDWDSAGKHPLRLSLRRFDGGGEQQEKEAEAGVGVGEAGGLPTCP